MQALKQYVSANLNQHTICNFPASLFVDQHLFVEREKKDIKIDCRKSSWISAAFMCQLSKIRTLCPEEKARQSP